MYPVILSRILIAHNGYCYILGSIILGIEFFKTINYFFKLTFTYLPAILDKIVSSK